MSLDPELFTDLKKADQELKNAVDYCHKHGVKVHLTLNTLISDGELDDAQDAVRLACEAGVDAIIVQDLGLADIIRRCAPDMPMHASTQMSVQTPAGLKKLKKLGFKLLICVHDELIGECPEENADAVADRQGRVAGDQGEVWRRASYRDRLFVGGVQPRGFLC